MHEVKKYFTEGLIQFTILLSLLGVRVDVDSYLSGYFSPIIEIDGGPSSAFVQTPFHHLRDTAQGHQLHPKCPELDYYFTSRRLLEEVRTLGSHTRFPTRLSAWLVHMVPDDGSDAPDTHDLPGVSGSAGESPEALRDEAEAEVEVCGPVSRPCRPVREDGDQQSEEAVDAPLNQLTQSSALEREEMLSPPLSGLAVPPRWQDFLAEFNDLDDLPNPIDLDVSLHDAMMGTSAGESPHHPIICPESTNSSSSDPHHTPAPALPASLFTFYGDQSGNLTTPAQGGGFLDEAVFDQINLLDLVDPRVLHVEDSDSGLECSRSAASSDSFCEDEGGATGYSSEVESLGSKGANIWHDHTYSSAAVKQEVTSEEEEAEPEEPSRDERRVQALGLPFSALQIVNMPVEHFLELLERKDLPAPVLRLLRDVRRRGKNKLAAQNCRRRKLDAIVELQGEVEALQTQRGALLRQRAHTARALLSSAQRLRSLSQDVLSLLTDECGRPLRAQDFTLHVTSSGRVTLQPRRGGRKKSRKT